MTDQNSDIAAGAGSRLDLGTHDRATTNRHGQPEAGRAGNAAVQDRAANKTRRHSALLITLAASISTGHLALAQTVPDNTVQNQRDDEQRQRLRQRMESAPSVQLQGPLQPKADKIPQEQPCLIIQTVRLEPPLLRHAQLDEALAGPTHDDPPQGKCIGLAGLTLLAQRAQDGLVAAGYITSEVVLGAQDLRSGNVVLNVTPGRIGEIRSAQSGASSKWSLATLAIRPGEVLNLRDIEQSLENLQRDGAAEVNIEIVKKPDGLSDILINHRPAKGVRLNLVIDDTGSPSTGKELGNATVSFSNQLELSELVYLNLGRNLADRSVMQRGSRSYTLHAGLPLGYWHFSATFARNTNYQTLPGLNELPRYSGETQYVEAQASRVVQRDALGKTTLTLSAFARRAKNDIEDTEILVQRRRTGGWELSVSRSQRLDEVNLQARLRYRRGTGAFGAIPAPEEVLGEGTSRMQLLQADLQLLAPLRLAGLPMALSSELRMQWHRTPLTPQDRMCLGGRYTVRGFDDSQAVCGLSGQLLRNELSARVSDVPLVWYAGVDFGRVTNEPNALQPSQTLIGAFAGLRGALPIGFGQWDLFAGTPLKKPNRQASSQSVAGFQISANF